MRHLKLIPILSLLLSTACAVAQPQQPTTGGEAMQPQRGGTFQFSAQRPPDSLFYYESMVTGNPLGLVYDTLIDYQYEAGVNWQIDFPLAPALAKSWEQVDSTTYLFHLQDGVKWQDGVDLTAGDIAYSYETIRNPKVPVVAAGLLKDADKIEVVDPKTVRITTKAPAAEFLALLANGAMKILPKHIADRGLKHEENVVGTGPFKLTAFERLAKATASRNENHWRDGPYVDRVVTIYGLDTSARLAAFATRAIDMMNLDDQVQMDSVRAAVPDVKYQSFQTPYGYGIYFKLDQAPFSDIRVRRAMHLAVDRKAMFDTLTHGLGVINPPGMPGAKKGWTIPEEELLKLPGWRQPKDQDIAEAKRLLAEAGYPSGFKTTIAMNRTQLYTPQLTEMLAAQMKPVGIDMSVQGQEIAVYTKTIREGSFETLMALFGNMLPDRNLYTYFHSQGPLNSAPLKDATIDRLLEAQSRELDVTKRKQTLIEFQRRMLDQMYYVPTVDAGSFAAWQPYVHNYVFNFGAQPYLVDPRSVWLDVKNVPAGR